MAGLHGTDRVSAHPAGRVRRTTSRAFTELAAGAAICTAVRLLPIPGLMPDGKKCLAMSLCAVCWWATGAMHPGYTALALLAGYTLFLDSELVPAATVFGLWTTPTMYLVVGGFLIAKAVEASGLGRRAALAFISRFTRSYGGMVFSCYLLGLLLSFVIPHPWPRSFLLLSVMSHAARSAGLSQKAAANLKLAVFVASVPASMILLTGDSTLNPLIGGFAGTTVSWLQWLVYMGPPGLLALALTGTVQLLSYRQREAFQLDLVQVRSQLADLGKLTRPEMRVIAVMAAAVLFWITDSLHGLNRGAFVCSAAACSARCKVLERRKPRNVVFSVCGAGHWFDWKGGRYECMAGGTDHSAADGPQPLSVCIAGHADLYGASYGVRQCIGCIGNRVSGNYFIRYSRWYSSSGRRPDRLHICFAALAAPFSPYESFGGLW